MEWYSHTMQDDAIKKKEVNLDLHGQIMEKNSQVIVLIFKSASSGAVLCIL